MFTIIAGRQVFVAVIEQIFGALGTAAEQPLLGIHEAYALSNVNRARAKRAAAKLHRTTFNFPALRAQDRIANYSLLDFRTARRAGNAIFGNPADVSRPLVVLTDQTTFHFNAGRTEGRAESVATAA